MHIKESTVNAETGVNEPLNRYKTIDTKLLYLFFHLEIMTVLNRIHILETVKQILPKKARCSRTHREGPIFLGLHF